MTNTTKSKLIPNLKDKLSTAVYREKHSVDPRKKAYWASQADELEKMLFDLEGDKPVVDTLTGGRNNYYLVNVDNPQREDQPAYQAECEDIIEALGLTPNEANIFKAIWRSANARLNNGKPDHKALYDAQKMVHYSKRVLRKAELAEQTQNTI
jgi:hypothetical protein